MANFGNITMAPQIAALQKDITAIMGPTWNPATDPLDVIAQAATEGRSYAYQLHDVQMPILKAEHAANLAAIGANNTILADLHDVHDPAIIAAITILTANMALKENVKLVGATASTAAYVSVLDITDKGFLTGISQYPIFSVSDEDIDGFIKLTIDGGVEYDGDFCHMRLLADKTHAAGIGVCFDHKFETSLKVEHKVGSINQRARTLVAYTND